MSREIPPCMAQGQAVGIAAALAVDKGLTVREVPTSEIQTRMRDQGADPGDQPSANATIDEGSVAPADHCPDHHKETVR